MIPSSVPVIVATALLTLAAALVLAWGYWRGHFRDLEAQSRVIFEPRDWRVARPWETPVDRLERETMYGDPLPAFGGEWGGAERAGTPEPAPVAARVRVADGTPDRGRR